MDITIPFSSYLEEFRLIIFGYFWRIMQCLRTKSLLPGPFLRNLRPGVPQADGLVEHRPPA
jgi:hypothetical protein